MPRSYRIAWLRKPGRHHPSANDGFGSAAPPASTSAQATTRAHRGCCSHHDVGCEE
ncbi:MAG: hypothetical protein IPN17_29245 [Deltaproteobacteria bacterium]|nr:hypothetical protein [Deltaproteobacteria bacterium]